MKYHPEERGHHGPLLCWLLSLVLLLGSTAGSAQEPPPKLPVPEQGAQARAEAQIKELFRTAYARRKPMEVQALALTLLQQGLETKDDDTARFVLLREARELAARAGEHGTAGVCRNGPRLPP